MMAEDVTAAGLAPAGGAAAAPSPAAVPDAAAQLAGGRRLHGLPPQQQLQRQWVIKNTAGVSNQAQLQVADVPMCLDPSDPGGGRVPCSAVQQAKDKCTNPNTNIRIPGCV